MLPTSAAQRRPDQRKELRLQSREDWQLRTERAEEAGERQGALSLHRDAARKVFFVLLFSETRCKIL